MNEILVGEEQATRRTDEPKPAEVNQDLNPKQPRLNQRHDAAESLRKRFIEAGEQFYYRTAPGEPTKIAFTDHGKRLVTEHDDPNVIQGMVLRAKAKGWTTIRVNGTAEFKTEAWVQATIAGLDVEGYSPRAIDLARAEDRREPCLVRRKTAQPPVDREASHDRATDDHTRTSEKPLSFGQQIAVTTLEAILKARGDSPTMIAASVQEAKARLLGDRIVVGTVVDHGIDHYGHDIQNAKSCFVKVASDHGEREIWGVDLGPAFEQGKVQRGDAVALVQQTHDPMTKDPVRDGSGPSIRANSQPTTRNRWEIIKLDTLGVREQHQLNEAMRVGTQEPVVPRFDHAAARTDRTPNVMLSPSLERTRGSR